MMVLGYEVRVQGEDILRSYDDIDVEMFVKSEAESFIYHYECQKKRSEEPPCAHVSGFSDKPVVWDVHFRDFKEETKIIEVKVRYESSRVI